MTVLMGPADADAWRVSKGWQRFYTDPLPGCDIAPESEADYPSISAVKKAEGQDWSRVSLKRVADASDNDWATMASLPPARRLDAMNSINKYGLDLAAGRGTIIHLWGEDLLDGKEPREFDPMDLAALGVSYESLQLALKYKAALIDFFESYQPRLVAKEFPVIHRTLNGVGYGGTPDGIWYLDNPPPGKSVGPWAFDYKTRTVNGKQHAAYPEEAEQIAAGATAEYMAIEDPDTGQARRVRIPELAGGMVVSIKPDGARVFPIDLEKAADGWRSRHARYVKKLTERESIGRVWPIWNGGGK